MIYIYNYIYTDRYRYRGMGMGIDIFRYRHVCVCVFLLPFPVSHNPLHSRSLNRSSHGFYQDQSHAATESTCNVGSLESWWQMVTTPLHQSVMLCRSARPKISQQNREGEREKDSVDTYLQIVFVVFVIVFALPKVRAIFSCRV